MVVETVVPASLENTSCSARNPLPRRPSFKRRGPFLNPQAEAACSSKDRKMLGSGISSHEKEILNAMQPRKGLCVCARKSDRQEPTSWW